MSAPDRRTVGELLADSDGLARGTLLDATLDHAPAMVRSWHQVVGSAAELWAVLPSAQSSRFIPHRDRPVDPDSVWQQVARVVSGQVDAQRQQLAR